MSSRIVQFASEPEDQIFELTPFILQDENEETDSMKIAACNIAAAFNHRLFLDVLDEVSRAVALKLA